MCRTRDRWLADSVRDTVQQRTLERYEQLVRVHIKPSLGPFSQKEGRAVVGPIVLSVKVAGDALARYEVEYSAWTSHTESG